MTRAEAACLRPLLERLGIPYEYRESDVRERWFGWNGMALNLASRSDFSSVIHEVAHWQLAGSARRGFADFGLEHMLEDASRREEDLASLLGILIERHLGLPWQDTWSFHDWDRNDDEPGKGWRLRRYFRQLQQAGLLRGLTPTCFLGGAQG